ncbi:hypothetical protein Syn7502_00951 [Synechococcus sp. PCC 7502]|uniref:DUF427 domain-containing protein n=1 Tax=Synechococcus sp. PCC 7502 TaxID=1173263 RepID=UPI00029FABA0|nr:DUF427 domain-containing protein [Synechococcus sp. PCC 7502]AFY73066.1 hypothetical protein Syn7502_00951 [Synechococcus sp. PCC 7502]
MFNPFNQIVNKPIPIPPQQGQESVWDYPRPPRLEDTSKLIEIVCNGVVIAKTNKAKRVLETSHPPVYYISPEDIVMEYVIPASGTSFCEWKGLAIYYSVKVNGKLLEKVAWSYPEPTEAFSSIKDYIAFYPAPMDGCYVNGEKVTPQPGGFYGGWITSDIVGPFKGDRSSMGW